MPRAASGRTSRSTSRLGAAPGSSWARRNFGCGSSREAAVYALYDYGIRCVIAPSFGDIFSGNAVQNGLLTAIVTDENAAEIMATLAHTPELAGDRRSRAADDRLRQPELPASPSIRSAALRLLKGWDDIALTESYRDRISAFKRAIKAAAPGPLPLLNPNSPRRGTRVQHSPMRHRYRGRPWQVSNLTICDVVPAPTRSMSALTAPVLFVGHVGGC